VPSAALQHPVQFDALQADPKPPQSAMPHKEQHSSLNGSARHRSGHVALVPGIGEQPARKQISAGAKGRMSWLAPVCLLETEKAASVA
jgi:hypothetical protein